MTTSDPHAGVVTCPVCELHISVTKPNEAVEAYRRHNRVTGHEIEWERTALGVTAPSTDTETALTALDKGDPEGVPVGVLTAALSHSGVPISEVLEDLYALRMRGAIYEPSEDHFRVL